MQSDTVEREYRIPKAYQYLLYVGVLAFGAFCLFCLSLPIIEPQETPEEERRQFWFMVFAGGGFGAVAIFCLYGSLTFHRSNITVDAKGLWYSYLTRRDGFVPWEAIVSVRERPFLQRLELCDANGKRLLSLEFPLMGFEELRDEVYSRLPPLEDRVQFPLSFSRSNAYHIVSVGGSVLLLAVAIALAQYVSVLLGLGFAVILLGLGLSDYAKTLYQITVYDASIHLHYPLRTVVLPREEVLDVAIGNAAEGGFLIPTVLLLTERSEKPIVLQRLKGDTTFLYTALCVFLKQAEPKPHDVT